MPYINVDEAYILDNTGLQVDQVADIPYTDAALTDTQKAQARKNIAAGGTNPNLLDNPWWGQGEVINQRAFTSLSGAGAFYTIDRWDRTSNSSLALTLTNSGMRFTLSSNGSWTFFRQYIGRKINEDATYTFSIMDDDGNIYSATGQFVTGTSSETYVNIGGMSLGLGMYGKGVKPYVALGFGTNRAGEFTIRAVKLELGSVSTLANDTPPNYADELAKCQRYFIRLEYTDTGKQVGFGYMYNTTQARILVPTPVTMRTGPTVTTTNLGGAFRVNAGGTYLTPSAVSAIATALPNGVNINFGTSSAGTSGAIATVFSYGEGSIDFSADL